MKNVYYSGIVVLTAMSLSGCDETYKTGLQAKKPEVVEAAGPDDAAVRPIARPTIVPKPAAAAQTAEQFDTTTDAQRAKAASTAPASGARKLGATVGALGNPTEPGFWLKTPLVTAPTKGRIEYAGNGKSVSVDLIPIEGPKTAGSQVSLAAMRLLDIPLTGLPDLIVFVE